MSFSNRWLLANVASWVLSPNVQLTHALTYGHRGLIAAEMRRALGLAKTYTASRRIKLKSWNSSLFKNLIQSQFSRENTKSAGNHFTVRAKDLRDRSRLFIEQIENSCFRAFVRVWITSGSSSSFKEPRRSLSSDRKGNRNSSWTCSRSVSYRVVILLPYVTKQQLKSIVAISASLDYCTDSKQWSFCGSSRIKFRLKIR